MSALDPRRTIYRRFSLNRLVTGLAAVAIGVGIQVVAGPWHGHVSAKSLLAMALGLVGAGIGLTLVLRPRADFCGRCDVQLVPNGLRLRPDGIVRATAALRQGDAAHALREAGEPVPDGKWLTIWYCPRCRSTVIWGDGSERVVASGGEGIVAAVTGRR